MRNKYPGICYRCGTMVEKGEGHPERHNGGWRTQHVACAILWREKRDKETIARERDALRLESIMNAED